MTTLRDVSNEQLFCMAGGFNHHWEAISKPTRVGQWGRRRNDLCVRCGKERITIRDVHDRTAARYYTTPAWHIKVSTPYDSYDVSEEIGRRLVKQPQKRSTRQHLKAV